jgi:hypothetical protein
MVTYEVNVRCITFFRLAALQQSVTVIDRSKDAKSFATIDLNSAKSRPSYVSVCQVEQQRILRSHG